MRADFLPLLLEFSRLKGVSPAPILGRGNPLWLPSGQARRPAPTSTLFSTCLRTQAFYTEQNS